MSTRLGRFEGRLFAEGGCLFLVVHADEATDMARVTCRIDGQRQVVDMPLAEVAQRVASNTGLILDNLNGPESKRRIFHRHDGWYFSAREGEMGPFPSQQDARRKLVTYILSMQAANDSAREPLRSAGSRRDEHAGRQAAGYPPAV